MPGLSQGCWVCRGCRSCSGVDAGVLAGSGCAGGASRRDRRPGCSLGRGAGGALCRVEGGQASRKVVRRGGAGVVTKRTCWFRDSRPSHLAGEGQRGRGCAEEQWWRGCVFRGLVSIWMRCNHTDLQVCESYAVTKASGCDLDARGRMRRSMLATVRWQPGPRSFLLGRAQVGLMRRRGRKELDQETDQAQAWA